VAGSQGSSGLISFLEGVKVIDLSWLIPGPYVSMLLSDFGADVIKVEDTNSPDYLRTSIDAARHGGTSSIYQWLNRNKRGIAVNTREPEGVEIVRTLAREADVLVEGFRPGVAERRGLGYADISELNPSIVYCSVTGFGQSGPWAAMATHGGAYDAVAGLAVPYRLDDGTYAQYRPFPHGLTYGSWLAAMAVSAALTRAKTAGEGCYIDISCVDATMMALAQEALPVLNDGAQWPPDAEDEARLKYCYYETKDGRFMLLQALERPFWEAFCDVAGRPDLKERGAWNGDPMDRIKAKDDPELRRELVDIFRSRTQAEWTKLFLENNVAGAPYCSLSEAARNEHFLSRSMFLEQQHPDNAKTITTVANATKVLGQSFEIRRPAPEFGQHSDEILLALGYEESSISDLRARRIVR